MRDFSRKELIEEHQNSNKKEQKEQENNKGAQKRLTL